MGAQAAATGAGGAVAAAAAGGSSRRDAAAEEGREQAEEEQWKEQKLNACVLVMLRLGLPWVVSTMFPVYVVHDVVSVRSVHLRSGRVPGRASSRHFQAGLGWWR